MNEYAADDCAVVELRCEGKRVAPDRYYGDRSLCDVRVRCQRG